MRPMLPGKQHEEQLVTMAKMCTDHGKEIKSKYHCFNGNIKFIQ